MTNTIEQVSIVGAGRMGRGIALAFSLAGINVSLIDLKSRSDKDRQSLFNSAKAELTADLNFLASLKLFDAKHVNEKLALIQFVDRERAGAAIGAAPLIFEAVPEVMAAKKECFGLISQMAEKNALIASTTSTFLVNELAELVTCPERFVNAHWLNPAHLMPLVELSKGDKTSDATVDTLRTFLESAGKVPVVCGAAAGYIVPRIQALAMNEAARLVEEGVASAEDVDKAVKYGFGPRFAVLGLLEFIDWGGGDILYYASNYLSQSIDKRYGTAQVVVDNMKEGRNGLRDGKGFFDYKDVDVPAYRDRRMTDFVRLMKYLDILPKIEES
jgi:3-hydroxybutyryl-CoA dehydrogenase